MEMLCMVLSLEQIEKVAEKVVELDSNPEKMTKALRGVVKQYREAEEKKRQEVEKKVADAKMKREEKKQEVAWTTEEYAALAKATKIFPSGTRNRWECLANHIGTRNAEEVQRKVGELRKGGPPPKEAPKKSAPSVSSNDPSQWSVSQQKQLESGLRTHKALKGNAKWIEVANGAYGAPILFAKKKDGGLRMCIDYRALNS